jgi:hypothetical protein
MSQLSLNKGAVTPVVSIFPIFTNFPPEIRNMIWPEAALEAEIISVCIKAALLPPRCGTLIS